MAVRISCAAREKSLIALLVGFPAAVVVTEANNL
jgi:hypothetical protein